MRGPCFPLTADIRIPFQGAQSHLASRQARRSFRPRPEEHPCKSLDLHGCVSKERAARLVPRPHASRRIAGRSSLLHLSCACRAAMLLVEYTLALAREEGVFGRVSRCKSLHETNAIAQSYRLCTRVRSVTPLRWVISCANQARRSGYLCGKKSLHLKDGRSAR